MHGSVNPQVQVVEKVDPGRVKALDEGGEGGKGGTEHRKWRLHDPPFGTALDEGCIVRRQTPIPS